MRWMIGMLLLAGIAAGQSRVFGPDGSYSLVPPAGWAFQKVSRTEIKLTSGSSSLDVDTAPKPTDVTSPAYQQSAKTTMIPKGMTLKSGAPVTVAGNPGFQLDLFASGNPTRIVIVSDKHRTWVITMQSTAAERNTHFPLMEESAATLLFK